MDSTVAKGHHAETLVVDYLQARGFEIVCRNLRVGRYEIDIVARRNGLLVICEVRSLKASSQVHPAETLRRDKLQRIRRATSQWLLDRQEHLGAVRFDVASVTFDRHHHTIDYYENAF